MAPPLIGRSRELAALEIATTSASPVTVRGPGGVGKTTLARALWEARPALWIEMSGVHGAGDAAGVLATAIGVAPGETLTPDALGRAAERFPRIVIDNVEDLDGSARELVLAFARRTSGRVLLTSREAIGDEATFDLGALDETDGVLLLSSIAGGTSANAAMQREIVRRLDGLPLAIELAARRISILGHAGLLERLDRKLDVLGVTLRETIQWSWEHLDPHARTALLACSTFEGLFDAGVAEIVIAASTEAEALDRLEDLRSFGLLHSENDGQHVRLRLREAVRDFARERLAEVGSELRDALWKRYAAAIATTAAPLADALGIGAAVGRDLARFRTELGAVWRRRLGQPHAWWQAGLALSTLALHLGQTELVTELDVAMAAGDAQARAARGRLLVVKAAALRAASRHLDASVVADEASGISTSLPEDIDGAWSLRVDALRVAGAIARSRGLGERAAELVGESLARAKERGDRAREALALGELGAIAQSRGRLQLASSLHLETIALHVAIGNRRGEGLARSFLAVATHRAGKPADAIPLHESALAIHRETGHHRLEGAELLHLGFVLHEIDELARAQDVFDEATRVLAMCGARGLEAYANVLRARLDVDRGDVARARHGLAEAKRLAPAGFPRLDAARLLVEGHLGLAIDEPRIAEAAYAAAIDASSDVEVGFEALTPCWLALARRCAGEPVDSRLLERARIATKELENPYLRLAADILCAAVEETVPVVAPEIASRSSSDVRRAIAQTKRRGGLIVADHGSKVTLPDGRLVDLSRRKSLRRIVEVLARARRERPGTAVPPADLVEAGWPGERMRADAATKRLHTAIWALRSFGFDAVLRTDETGYHLDPAVSLNADFEPL